MTKYAVIEKAYYHEHDYYDQSNPRRCEYERLRKFSSREEMEKYVTRYHDSEKFIVIQYEEMRVEKEVKITISN